MSHHRHRFNLINFKGGSCNANTVDVSQYTNPDGMIHTQDGYQNIFERIFLNPLPESNYCFNSNQSGGDGFTFDLTDPISNKPSVKNYSNCNSTLHSQGGYGRKKHINTSIKNIKSKSKPKRDSHHQLPSALHNIKHKKTKLNSKNHNKKSKKSKYLSHTKSIRYQRGGEDSIFTSDMTKRDFACSQPTWNTKCI